MCSFIVGFFAIGKMASRYKSEESQLRQNVTTRGIHESFSKQTNQPCAVGGVTLALNDLFDSDPCYKMGRSLYAFSAVARDIGIDAHYTYSSHPIVRTEHDFCPKSPSCF